jgi:hypothetical protein
MNKLMPIAAALALAPLLAIATPVFAQAAGESYTTTLSAAEEVPPTDSKGTGQVQATYDPASKMLKWSITYEGLTGDATAAHFHGPADPGANAPPVVPIPDDKLTSPIEGEATLTDAQAADLAAGKIYFNVHTAKYPDGEIRGQLGKHSD